MSSSLTPKQTLILWYLIGKGGAAWRGDIRPEPSSKDRKALENAKIITNEKRGRSLWIEVTETGWAWANDHLTASLPARAPTASPILQTWLGHLQEFLHRRNFSLADIFTPPARQTPAADATVTTEIEDRVRTAYLDATGGAWNRRVRLSELRHRLRDVARDRFDATLLKMQQASKLVLLDNQREITDADRDAALLVGGEPRHLLHMGG